MIESISLENIKAFRSVELPISHLTLLTGLNGSGKSTALQAVGAIFQSHEAGTLDDDGLLLNGKYVEWGTGQDVLHEDYRPTLGSRPGLGVGFELTSGDVAWNFTYERAADLLHFAEAHARSPLADDLLQVDFQYIRADRMVPAVYYPRSHEIVVRQRSLGSRGEYAVDYLREFGDNRVSPEVEHPAATSTTLIDQCSAWLGSLCPGVNVAASELEGTDLVRLRYQFYGTAGLSSSNSYRPTNVGFGLTYVLPVLIACLSASAASLILIENPEAHLHPRGQAALGELCARAAATGAQVLVESHSDHVLNGLRLAVKDAILLPDDLSILYFTRTETDVLVATPTVAATGMISDWPPGFFDEWENAIERLLE